MIEALQTHGLFYGGFLGIKHLELPSLGKTGYDPVPKKVPSQTLTFLYFKIEL
jgi:putative component of membrane protein insertase Oxa1/YidC/SpoIIIJ protein YidD